MPREIRKRGKKHKKQAEEPAPRIENVRSDEHVQPESSSGPSWIKPAEVSTPQDTDAPFGYVDVDVKAYFRTVDIQIRDWQRAESSGSSLDTEDTDPNAERHAFFMAALEEMRGKEKALATDPECSLILERIVHSMDDFVRRVFLDSLSGSWETLVKNRFASHVCQTMLTVCRDTISRESRCVFPVGVGDELRTCTQFVLEICEELLPSVTTLVADPFASHVVRTLLVLLVPTISSTILDPSTNSGADVMRSRKSASWKARQGPLKSVFQETDKGKGKDVSYSNPQFTEMGKQIILTFREGLHTNDIRALGADKVASPALHLLLEVEASIGLSDTSGSLMDTLTVGLVARASLGKTSLEPSDYLSTILRDSTASHLMETIVARSSDSVFQLLWRTYFEGKLNRLAVHPVVNYVVAKAIGRLDVDQLSSAVEDITKASVFAKIMESSRTGVVRASIERSVSLNCPRLGTELIEAIFGFLELKSEEEKLLLVPCLLHLQTKTTYQASSDPDQTQKVPLAPTIQGAVLLQSLLKLPSPENQPVLNSIKAQSPSELVSLTHHSVSSRILDMFLDSPVVPYKEKRDFVLSLIDKSVIHQIIDDRIGSRVADRIWSFADTYMKKKIATALIPQEQFLAASYFGKFFARNLHLYLLQKRPQEWMDLQSKQAGKQHAVNSESSNQIRSDSKAIEGTATKRKRAVEEGDEIDQLFQQASIGRRVKKGALARPSREKEQHPVDLSKDILSAIRTAPSGLKHKSKLS